MYNTLVSLEDFCDKWSFDNGPFTNNVTHLFLLYSDHPSTYSNVLVVILLITYHTKLCNSKVFADHPPKLRYVICGWPSSILRVDNLKRKLTVCSPTMDLDVPLDAYSAALKLRRCHQILEEVEISELFPLFLI